MSESMEREDNESLGAKQMEEEKEAMKRELMDIGMYESWYTYNEMKELLRFISESKDMANMGSENTNTQKQLHQASNESSSYRTSHTTSLHDRISTHTSSSPESMSNMLDAKSPMHRRKSSDCDEIFEIRNQRDNSSHITNRCYSLRTKNSLQEAHNVHTGEMKMDMQLEHNEKLDRWRINPLDCCVNENDVPLRQPDRPDVEDREPFRLCKDAQTTEMVENALIPLSLHLKEIAELWHSWHRTTDSKFQWGSPIQVGTVNGSLDKKPLAGSKTEQSETESTSKYCQARPSKRKLGPGTLSPTSRNFSEDDDAAEFVPARKKKTQVYDSPGITRCSSRLLSMDEVAMASHELTNEEEDELLDRVDITVKTEDKRTKKSQIRSHRKNADRLSPDLLSTYPRRIIPPNPRRVVRSATKMTYNNSARAKSKPPVPESDKEESTIVTPIGKKIVKLTNDEVLQELDTESDDNTPKRPAKSTEIKPLRFNGLCGRLERQFRILKQADIDKKKKLEDEKDEAQRNEEEQSRKRAESMKRQIKEAQNKQEQQEEALRKEREKSSRWNNLLPGRSKGHPKNIEKSKLLQEQDEIAVAGFTEHNTRFSDYNVTLIEDGQIMADTVTNSVNCPICNRQFPSDAIEAHAAECEQYNTDNDEDYSSRVTIFQDRMSSGRRSGRTLQVLECNVCSTFRTTNGIEYEDHVNSCLQRKKRTEQSPPYAGTSMHNIANSPIRCYRPISQQTDSEIDYKAQFAPSSKTRKRKH